MTILDKKSLLKTLGSIPTVELELGCGPVKKVANAIGIDALNYPAVDIVGDVFEVLRSFPAASVNGIYSYHFVEHIADLAALLDEMARVLKPDGKLEIVAPHFSNPYFYSDPTHRTFFGLYTFCYFANVSLFSREVPRYGLDVKFDLVDVDLIFKSTRPFIVRHALKRLLGACFNCCTYMKEFYEENFSGLIPCYEVRYRLRKIGAGAM